MARGLLRLMVHDGRSLCQGWFPWSLQPTQPSGDLKYIKWKVTRIGYPKAGTWGETTRNTLACLLTRCQQAFE